MRSFKGVDSRRVVVTGLGSISPVGNTVKQGWNSILSGTSGISKISQFDTTGFAQDLKELFLFDRNFKYLIPLIIYLFFLKLF